MSLDPDPKVYRPSDVELNETPAFFTKYIFWDQPSENCGDKAANSGRRSENDDGNDSLSFEDVTVEELDRALTVEEEDDGNPNQLAQPVPPKLKDEQFPRILFLGTSAAGSFPLRNSTGILVHLS